VTRIDQAFAAFAVVCVALFIWQVATPQGVRVTVTPIIEPDVAIMSGKWMQVFHGLTAGRVQHIISTPLSELYPASGWALLNCKGYAENRTTQMQTVRLAGVVHWVGASMTLPTFDMHGDATLSGGTWTIETEIQPGPAFVDFWCQMP